MNKLIETLNREGCSVVIRSQGQERCFWKRGVADLLSLLTDSPEVLLDASLADKVVGKGAAALMILGRVHEVYAHIISQPALSLLQQYGVTVSYGECVPNIINRAGTGLCPVESLCLSAESPEECLPLIQQFVQKMQNQSKNQ